MHGRARLPEGSGDPSFLGLYAPGDGASIPAMRRLGALVLTASTPYDPQRNGIQTYDAAGFEECMRTRGYERAPARP